MADGAIAPTSPATRIDALDVIRGIAVCGILAVNIFVMGTVGSNQGKTFPAELNADWVTWVTQRTLLEGPMRGLFMVLFGAGMVMMLRKAEGDRPQVVPIDVWTRRCLALLALGVVHFLILMWPGEILWTLGVAGLALLAFRTARARTLWIWALIIVACLSGHRAWHTSTYFEDYNNALAGERAQAEGRAPTEAEKAGLAAVKSAVSANYPKPEVLEKEIAQRTTLWPLIGWSTSGWAYRHLGVYSWLAVAESLAFMLVGMALFRSRVLTGEASARIYRWMLLAGAAGLALRLLDMAWQARTGFELDIHRLDMTMSLLRSAWYQPARLGLTLGYVAALVLLLRRGRHMWAAPFRAMGRTALTVYTLQSLLTSLFFYALGYVGAFGAAALMLVTLGICILTALFSMAWLRFRPMGPLEWLLRAIAYGSFSPSRRRGAADALERGPPL